MFVANIGDAKAVVARSSAADGLQNTLDGGTPLKAIVLTREHKAIYPQERARIQKVRSLSREWGREIYLLLVVYSMSPTLLNPCRFIGDSIREHSGMDGIYFRKLIWND